THTATLGRSLNFTRLRLHGRIEGNVNELCAQLEKSRPIKVESGNSTRRIEDLITIRPMLLLYEEGKMCCMQWTLFLLWLEYCINQRLIFNPCLCQEMALSLKTSLVNWLVPYLI
ncbi:BnaCnng23970D, partial [Brassica napus]